MPIPLIYEVSALKNGDKQSHKYGDTNWHRNGKQNEYVIMISHLWKSFL